MELQHINIKIPLSGELGIDLYRFMEIFHDWVREQSMDELLIDVADYRHVPEGPGVMLIGLQADYSMDNVGGEWGLLYNRKDALDGTNADRIAQAFSSAVRVCGLLESAFAPDGLAFSRNDLELIVNDRALAPNTDETWAGAKDEIAAALEAACGSPVELTREADPRRRFGARARCAAGFGIPAPAAA